VCIPLLDRLLTPPPRQVLGCFPSPVEDHPALARSFGLERLLVKRDDLNATPFGGNKVRALEWLVPRLGPAVVTMGGYGSTWCAALAVVAAQSGRRAHAALFPQPWTPTVAGALATTLSHGEVGLVRSRWGLPLAVGRLWRGARRHGAVSWVPAGGAAPLGVLGSVNAALEFITQLDREGVPRPEAIVLPLGSGGTAAGLLVGMWLTGCDMEICAVRVTDPWFATRSRVLALARHTLALLARCGLRVTPGRACLRLVPDQLGAGYGSPTPAAQAAQATMAGVGIAVDLTYGAKACAAITALATSFRHLCFWHTFDTRLLTQSACAHPLIREAREQAETLWPHRKSI
jgi:D-cysteine desulfhydrase